MARDGDEAERLLELKKRGDANGVSLEIVEEAALHGLEPNARTFGHALYSPATSTVDPVEVVGSLARELEGKSGVRLIFSERFIKRDGPSAVITGGGRIRYGHLINTAGLYADRVARAFGAGEGYSLLPFKGLYLKYMDDALLRMHVYPVPDLMNPFLGVHFTKTATGAVKAGPTAAPAFWRENYDGLSNFSPQELLEVLYLEARCFYLDSFGFRRVSLEEFREYFGRYFIRPL